MDKGMEDERPWLPWGTLGVGVGVSVWGTEGQPRESEAGGEERLGPEFALALPC